MRYSSTALVALAALCVLAACGEPVGVPDGAEPARDSVPVTISFNTHHAVSGTVVEIAAEDIHPPILVNLPVSGDTASGTVMIPAGSNRVLTVRAFDARGIETHRGFTTVDVHPGGNLAVTITLDPLTGGLPVTVTVATVTVTLDVDTLTLDSGSTRALVATVVEAGGDTVSGPAIVWGSSNPIVASVTAAGIVQAGQPGTAVVSAAYGRTSARTAVTVLQPAPPPPAPELVVFQTNRDGNYEVYTLDPTDSSVVNLTGNAATDWEPEASPDGSKIAFRSDRGGTLDIWVMDRDGGSPVNVSDGIALTRAEYAWAPDGARITFPGDSTGGNWDLWMVNADGTGRVNLTASDTLQETRPDWSPDGRHIAFERAAGTVVDIWYLGVDSGTVHRVTNTIEREQLPVWSPDSDLLLFRRQFGTSFFDSRMFTVRIADSSEAVVWSTAEFLTGTHAWAPDGNRIAYEVNVTAIDVFVINVDGTDRTNLTQSSTNDFHPAWSPDGNWILFTRIPDMEAEDLFWIPMDSAGAAGAPVNLTSDAAEDRLGSWLAAGS